MQTKLKCGDATFRMRNIGLSVAILASATLSVSTPDRALAACGGSSHPAGVHAAGGGGGLHVATGIAAPAGGGGGGGTPRVRRRLQRRGAAWIANRRLRQGRRDRRTPGAHRKPCEDRCDKDRERRRAYACLRAWASRLTTGASLARRRICRRRPAPSRRRTRRRLSTWFGFSRFALFRCENPRFWGLEKLGFPWILSSESRLINGLHAILRKRFLLALLSL